MNKFVTLVLLFLVFGTFLAHASQCSYAYVTDNGNDGTGTTVWIIDTAKNAVVGSIDWVFSTQHPRRHSGECAPLCRKYRLAHGVRGEHPH